MLLLWLLEYAFLVLFFAGMVTQVVWPMLRGTQLFPILRRESELEANLAAKRQKELEDELAKELEKKA